MSYEGVDRLLQICEEEPCFFNCLVAIGQVVDYYDQSPEDSISQLREAFLQYKDELVLISKLSSVKERFGSSYRKIQDEADASEQNARENTKR